MTDAIVLQVHQGQSVAREKSFYFQLQVFKVALQSNWQSTLTINFVNVL